MNPFDVETRCQLLFSIMPDDREFNVKYPHRRESRLISKRQLRNWLSLYGGYDNEDRKTFLSFCNQVWEELNATN
jgi:hypothetical protein